MNMYLANSKCKVLATDNIYDILSIYPHLPVGLLCAVVIQRQATTLYKRFPVDKPVITCVTVQHSMQCVSSLLEMLTLFSGFADLQY